MTWSDRTAQERADLRKRRTARRDRKQRHVVALWDGKARRAQGSDRDQAAYQFDLARKVIENGPDGQRDGRYRRLAAVIAGFVNELGGDGG